MSLLVALVAVAVAAASSAAAFSEGRWYRRSAPPAAIPRFTGGGFVVSPSGLLQLEVGRSMAAKSDANDDPDPAASVDTDPFSRPSAGERGRVLVLGGSGFLGGTVARRAVLEGYAVTSLSRRGKPAETEGGNRPRRRGRFGGGEEAQAAGRRVDYRAGDARDGAVVEEILMEGGYVGERVIRDAMRCEHAYSGRSINFLPIYGKPARHASRLFPSFSRGSSLEN